MCTLKHVTGFLVLAVGMSLGGSPPAWSGEGYEAIEPASSQHIFQAADTPIPYMASWSEFALKSEDGTPQATVSATSYVRTDVSDEAVRPVAFIFNGGPGASSSPLHFSALGPRQFEGKREKGVTRVSTDNPDSLLPVADLVFIDPVGTGYSRAVDDKVGANYWSIDGDAAAVLTYIGNWLEAEGRTGSPVFIIGESYGGFRLATMAPDLQGLNVKGLILVSPMLDASGSSEATGNDMPYVFSFPSMAVAAWHHGRSAIEGQSATEVWEKARSYAAARYAPALMEGGLLGAKERMTLANELSGWLGLSAEMITEANLRVGKQAFLEALMDHENKLVSRLNMLVTAEKKPAANPDRPAAANDPSLGLGRSNVIVSAEIGQYLNDFVGVKTDRDYNSLTLDVNFRWDWGSKARGPRFYFNQAPLIAKAMTDSEEIQLLVLGGYYDLATPVMAAHYAVTHSGVPMDRVTFRMLAAGHSPFEGEGNLAKFSTSIMDFMKAAGGLK